MSPNTGVVLPSCPSTKLLVPVLVTCGITAGFQAGYNPSLVGVLGTNVPYVASYSLMVTVSPIAKALNIVIRGPSTATM